MERSEGPTSRKPELLQEMASMGTELRQQRAERGRKSERVLGVRPKETLDSIS